MAAGMDRTRRVALVTCSVRSPRLNPFITQYVREVVNAACTDDDIIISNLDLGAHELPLYNEPAIPSHLPSDNPTPHYHNEPTRKWSATIRQYHAFVFVTPQYNWSIPASLKNALDFLFHEWKGKPAAIVSYGGKGGGKAADHLRQILTGLRMHVVMASAQIAVHSTTLDYCIQWQEISPQDRERWLHDGVQCKLRAAFAELIEAL